MANNSDMQALAVVSSEIDTSKWEVVMSIQCRKAQLYLSKHLRNEAANFKKECQYLSSNNSALDDEIKHAELEKMSLQSSLATITANRIETKYRYHIAKEKKLETFKRVEDNIVKYEQLLLERTKQFDKIPYVQRYHTTNNNTQILNTDINKLENEVDMLTKMLKEKQEKIKIEDRNKIIELAKYMIEERPKLLAAIKKKNSQQTKPKTVDLKDKQVVPKRKVKVDDIKDKYNSDWSFIGGGNGKEDSMVFMPELQATNDDLDSFSWNLDQLKRRVDRDTLTSINKPTNSVPITNLTQPKPLNKPSFNYLDIPDEPKKNYEQSKLIYILKDITLPKHDAENLVHGANPCDIKEIQSIGGKGDGAEKEQVQVEDQEEIEEVDMTPKPSQNLLQPPTQYMDMQSSESTKTKDEEMEVDKEPSQNDEQVETMSKNRRIAFKLPTIVEVPEGSESDQPEGDTSLMETSGDETYNILKEMMFKKHQLDSSPDFTYAKNVATLKTPTEKPITSKFFNENKKSPENKPKQIYPDFDQNDNSEQDENNIKEKQTENDNMEIDGNIAATPNEPDSQSYRNLLVRSVLFTHQAGAIPHSLNLSINTTDDGEGDFPQCFDASLLLSPKADPVPMSSDSVEVTSQDVPNFLSGLRKTEFSLFGTSSAGAQKADTGVRSQNGGFNFNFGGDNTGEKKRGNFLSMFQ